jgi:hypothetical protein
MKHLKTLTIVGSIAVVAFAFLLGLPGQAAAGVIFTAKGDANHSATASFDIAGDNLVITLTNTFSPKSDYKFKETEVLTALFFDVAGDAKLAPSAISAGSSKIWGADGTTLGQNWEYLHKASDLSGFVTQDYGISCAGLGIFHAGNFAKHGVNLQGFDWGLMPQTTTNFDHFNHGKCDCPSQMTDVFVQSTIAFTLSGFSTHSLSEISNVKFQYGTAVTCHSVYSSVPEPSVFALLGIAAMGLLVHVRRRRQG